MAKAKCGGPSPFDNAQGQDDRVKYQLPLGALAGADEGDCGEVIGAFVFDEG
jgi:hypothetical protein